MGKQEQSVEQNSGAQTAQTSQVALAAQKESNISIAAWTALILAAVALAFLSRFFSNDNNPLDIYIRMLPLLVAIVSLLLLLVGYFVLTRGLRAKTTRQKRTGVLLLTTGVFMLASHFLSLMIMPQILG